MSARLLLLATVLALTTTIVQAGPAPDHANCKPDGWIIVEKPSRGETLPPGEDHDIELAYSLHEPCDENDVYLYNVSWEVYKDNVQIISGSTPHLLFGDAGPFQIWTVYPKKVVGSVSDPGEYEIWVEIKEYSGGQWNPVIWDFSEFTIEDEMPDPMNSDPPPMPPTMP